MVEYTDPPLLYSTDNTHSPRSYSLRLYERHSILFLLLFILLTCVILMIVYLTRDHVNDSHTILHYTPPTTPSRNTDGTCTMPLIPVYNKTPVVIAGGIQGSTLELFTSPSSIALDRQRNVYICDSFNHRVMKFPVNERIGIVLINIYFPRKLTIDPLTDDLYVVGPKSDMHGYRVHYLPSTEEHLPTQPTVLFEQTGGESYGIALDTQLNIYTSEMSTGHVVKWFSPSYQTSIVIAGSDSSGSSSNQLNGPQGLYLNRNTNDLYIVDQKNHRIQKWSKDAQTGITAVSLAQESTPTEMQMDCHGNYFILDVGDRTVKLLSSQSMLISQTAILLGQPYSRGDPDSTDLTNHLGEPLSIYLDQSNGDLYITEYLHDRILKFTMDKFY